MKTCTPNAYAIAVLLAVLALPAMAQGTFQNLDFEDGTFVSIPGDPYGRVEWSAAVRGWTGYLGDAPITWVLHNNLFLSDPGIAIFGPDNPPGILHGHYYLQLQNAFPVPTDVPAIAQVGMLPSDALSLQFLTLGQYAVALQAFVAGNSIPLYHLGSDGNGAQVWGGDISVFSGQTVEIRFRGADFLDNIICSAQPIPEPSGIAIVAMGSILIALGYRVRNKSFYSAASCSADECAEMKFRKAKL